MELSVAREHTASRDAFQLFLQDAFLQDAVPGNSQPVGVTAEQLVRVLYTSSEAEDREALARAFVWGDDRTRFLLGRCWDPVGDEDYFWHERDLEDALPYVLELAVEANDIDALNGFVETLKRHRKLAYHVGHDVPVMHVWLSDAIEANPEMHIRFPGEVGRGTVKVLSRADRRGLAARLPPCFFDTLREDIMCAGHRWPTNFAARMADFQAEYRGWPRTHHALIETFEAVAMVRRYFAPPLREALAVKLLQDSGSEDGQYVASLTPTVMTANLQAVILAAAADADLLLAKRR